MQKKKNIALLSAGLTVTLILVGFLVHQPERHKAYDDSLTDSVTNSANNIQKQTPQPTKKPENETPAITSTPDKDDLVSEQALIAQHETITTTAPNTYLENIAALEEKNSFQEKFLAENEEQNRYPEFNQRIRAAELDPIERRYELDERTAESEDGKVTLSMWTNKKYYLHGDEVIVYATLQDKIGIRVPTTFIGMLIYNENKNLQEFEFQDWDQDGIYEHRFRLTQGQQPMPAGVYKVLIVNKANNMVNAVTFILSAPEIELTGNYKDTLDAQGNLVIGAEVEVTSKNRFYFQAALYTQANKPIGATQYSTELKPGKHWIPLFFDGLMIHDVGQAGPYLLKSVSLTKVALPAQRAPLIYPNFFTQDYKIEEFNNGSDNTVAAM